MAIAAFTISMVCLMLCMLGFVELRSFNKSTHKVTMVDPMDAINKSAPEKETILDDDPLAAKKRFSNLNDMQKKMLLDQEKLGLN